MKMQQRIWSFFTWFRLPDKGPNQLWFFCPHRDHSSALQTSLVRILLNELNQTRGAEDFYPFYTQQTETFHRNNTHHFSTVILTQLSIEVKEECRGLILLLPFPILPRLCAPLLAAGSTQLCDYQQQLRSWECLWGFSLPSTQPLHPSRLQSSPAPHQLINSPS